MLHPAQSFWMAWTTHNQQSRPNTHKVTPARQVARFFPPRAHGHGVCNGLPATSTYSFSPLTCWHTSFTRLDQTIQGSITSITGRICETPSVQESIERVLISGY